MAVMHDDRLVAFLNPQATEVFHSVEHKHEIWRDDPFDVESLHADAREVYHRLLSRATTPPGFASGRMLLMLGEAGCGKTHLIRAFRNHTHAESKGYVTYMQMTTQTNDYPRYVLSHVIESLDQPYRESLYPEISGLMRLSHALTSRALAKTDIDSLADPDATTQEELDALVFKATDRLLEKPGWERIDADVVRALIYLQRQEPAIKHRVLRFLRCEDMNDFDRRYIGGMAPRIHADDPHRVVEALGRLMWAINESVFVLCIDQMEEIFNFDESERRFRRAIATLCELADRVPSSIIVVSCLADFYRQMRAQLPGSHVDRLEIDPPPILLSLTHSRDDVRELVARRLGCLYERAGLSGADTTYPIPDSFLDRIAPLRTRDVLEECRRFRSSCIARGTVVDAGIPEAPPPAPPASSVVSYDQEWNDFRSTWRTPPPESDDGIRSLLQWAVSIAGDELETGHTFSVVEHKDAFEVDVQHNGQSTDKLFVRVCNKRPQGGGLANQINALRADAKKRRPVAIRTTQFPTSAGAEVVRLLGAMIAGGGRRLVLEDSELVAMAAFKEFRTKHIGQADFAKWVHDANPLTQLRSMRVLLDLDALEPTRGMVPGPPATPQPSPPPPPAAAPPPAERATPAASSPAAGQVVLGDSAGIFGKPLTLPTSDLRMHLAVLGGTGSGKTTAAMNLIEQVLLEGVPVVLIDRKGDLCAALKPETFTRPLSGERHERQRRLAASVAPQLFTPGAPQGRPLAISVLPDGVHALSEEERDEEAQSSANALADMLAYSTKGQGLSQRAILIQALRLLATSPRSIELADVIRFIDEPDPSLVNAAPHIDARLFRRVAENLEALRLATPRLFDRSGEKLDVSTMFEPRQARTPLTVISTKFLGDPTRVQFWVAQFLVQVTRWAVRNPSATRIRALLMFDEADLYLPAVSIPATKQPMENLLRRGRSAGISIMLATQSPGDFDYKCRDNIKTWLVGRITQQVAIKKMAAMLAEQRSDISGKLATRKTGEFFLLNGASVTSFTGHLPVFEPEQLSDGDILALAAATRASGGRELASGR